MNTKVKAYGLLFLLASLWGPSFLFLKIAVADLPPVTIACIRSMAGALILILVVWKKGLRFPTKPWVYVHFLLIGLFSMALPFSLITWSEQFIDSAMAAVVNSSMPLYTIILAHFMIPTESITFPKMIGLMVGLTGVLVLLLPSISLEGNAVTSGIIAASIAALSYGVGAVYAKLKMKGQPPLMATSLQLSASALLLLPASLVLEDPLLSLPQLQMDSLLALAYLSLIATVLAFYLYFKLLDKSGASFVSNVTYIMPLYGIVLGYVFLEETLSLLSLLGAVLIITGIGISGGLWNRIVRYSNCRQQQVCCT